VYLCTYVSEEVFDGEAAYSKTPSLLSYTLRYVSFAEVGSVCRVALRDTKKDFISSQRWGGGCQLMTIDLILFDIMSFISHVVVLYILLRMQAPY
jgi:hypothetical protein